MLLFLGVPPASQGALHFGYQLQDLLRRGFPGLGEERPGGALKHVAISSRDPDVQEMPNQLANPVLRPVQRAARRSQIGVIGVGLRAGKRGLLRLWRVALSWRRWQGLHIVLRGVERRLKLLPELIRIGPHLEKFGAKIVQGLVIGLGVAHDLLDPVEFPAPVLDPGVDVEAHRIVSLPDDRGLVDFRRLHGRAGCGGSRGLCGRCRLRGPWQRQRALGHGARAHDGENREKRAYNRATPQQHWIRPHSGSSNAAQVY